MCVCVSTCSSRQMTDKQPYTQTQLKYTNRCVLTHQHVVWNHLTYVQNYDKYKHQNARTQAYWHELVSNPLQLQSEYSTENKRENHIIIYIPIYSYWCFFFLFDSSEVKESESEQASDSARVCASERYR